MNKQIETRKALIITLTTVVITLAALFILTNISLRNQLKDERLHSESILSEKLLLDKSIAELKLDMAALKGKNVQLDRVLAQTSINLKNEEAEVRRLLSEKVSLADLKKKVAELEALRTQLNSDVAVLSAKANLYLSENDALNKKLMALQQEKDNLADDNAILKAMVADNYRIEAVKGKHEKITLNARKTDKLVVSFDLPAEINDNISFKVLTPSGQEYSSTDHPLTSMIIIDNSQNMVASIDNKVIGFNPRRVEMIFKPEQKLQRGIYRFNVYNDDNYLGSTQLRLK